MRIALVDNRRVRKKGGLFRLMKDGGKLGTLVNNTEKEQEKPGYWLEITITTTPEAAEMVGEVLIDHGCGGVVYHDPFVFADAQDGSGVIIPENLIKQDQPYRVSGYLPIREGLAETVAQIQSMLEIVAKELPMGEGKISCREVKEEDWANAWKAYFQKETIGRITILPSWIEEIKDDHEVVVKIDPGIAFSTGAHPSTRLCLQLLQETITGGETVFDIGAGSGILAISGALLGAARVIAVDIDPVAVGVARENVRRNGVETKVTVVQGDLLTDLPAGADLIVANIIAEVIMKITPWVSHLLNSRGAFISSGIIDSKASRVREALTEAGFLIKRELTEDGWMAFLARRG